MTQIKRKGIDVSDHNKVIDWDKVKADGIEFAMIRLGVGSDIQSQDDDYFARNVAECERVGIPWGVYIYSYALNVAAAKSELQHILRLLKGKKPTFPVAFDMEDADGYKKKHGMPSNSVLVDICYEVLLGIENAGYHAILYANLSWLNNQLNSIKLDRFDKWVAQWSDKCTYSKPYSMWQYAGDVSGAVNGVSGACDLNYAYSDYNSKPKVEAEAVVAKPVVEAKPVAQTTKGNIKIKAFQEWLNATYKTGIDTDGVFGPSTQKAALKAFQTELNKQYGAKLVVDGIWGSATKSKCPYVKRGMSGNITKILQGMLYSLGYDPKGIDGVFGSGTATAVVVFQKAKGLPKDTIAGPTTFAKLFI